MAGYSPDKIGSSPSYSSYNPMLQDRQSLDEECRKVFDEGKIGLDHLIVTSIYA